MRPQVGKGAREYKPPKEVLKTKARLFVEARKKHNLSMKEDYLTYRDVAVAMNMNALEQRMIAKQKILKLIEKGLPKNKLIELIEEDIHLDKHRLTNYFNFEDR